MLPKIQGFQKWCCQLREQFQGSCQPLVDQRLKHNKLELHLAAFRTCELGVISHWFLGNTIQRPWDLYITSKKLVSHPNVDWVKIILNLQTQMVQDRQISANKCNQACAWARSWENQGVCWDPRPPLPGWAGLYEGLSTWMLAITRIDRCILRTTIMATLNPWTCIRAVGDSLLCCGLLTSAFQTCPQILHRSGLDADKVVKLYTWVAKAKLYNSSQHRVISTFSRIVWKSCWTAQHRAEATTHGCVQKLRKIAVYISKQQEIMIKHWMLEHTVPYTSVYPITIYYPFLQKATSTAGPRCTRYTSPRWE